MGAGGVAGASTIGPEGGGTAGALETAVSGE